MGWYHTHLFSGKESGLSAIDVALHLGTFRQPWQVVSLINLTGDERLLRFYARSGDSMLECEQWVRDDSGRYRRACCCGRRPLTPKPGHADRSARGRADGPQDLAVPPPDVTAMLTRLAAQTAARLRLDALAAAERRPVGPGALLLAAAVGGRARPGLAAETVRTVPPARSLWDVLTHHAVVAPALPHIGDAVLAGRLRAASPLTALLDRPDPLGESAAENLLEDVLLTHPKDAE